MKHFKVTFQPANLEISVPEGTTIKEALDTGGLYFDFPCGGRGKCGKCRVQVLEGVSLPTAVEREHLEEREIEEGIRLACMTRIHGDLIVRLPFEKRPEAKILQIAPEKDVKLQPRIRKVYAEANPPSLNDQRPDWERLKAGAGLGDLSVPLPLLRKLPQIARETKYRITLVLEGEKVLGLEKFDTRNRLLGMAFDVGTTTVVGYLMDLRTGKELSVASTLNPQTSFGADVISRITFASQEKTGLEKLHRSIITALNELIGEAVEKAGVAREDIYALTVAGNTCMHHLLLGVDPTYLALCPYVPVTKGPLVFSAKELGIEINDGGRIYMLPNIAGFVGADTVAVILATDLDRSREIKLAVDIGTNGEIVLGNQKRLLACSAAAGPAFEGAQISCGMRGAKGAIDHVRFGEDLEFSVIGGGKPEGICGSGLIDVVAGLLERGIVDQRGKILSPHEIASPKAEKFKNNIVQHNGANAFLLVDESQTAHGGPILITQRDIRELQLAKGAIATGIQVLMEKQGIETAEITEVLLAGAFGNYLNPRSACAIGLLPPALAEKVKGVGNAAGTGAKAALLSLDEYQRAALISESVEYVELSAYPNFNSLFAGSLSFPEPAN